MPRDEFSERVKRTVAERAAYICANPTCRKPTVGPHSNPEKSLKTGEACHIRAAAPGGPRFDASQTIDQRTGSSNAIWLCTECSARIDKDPASYSAESLSEWKSAHESWIRNGGIVPPLPQITLSTINGRTVPDIPGTLTSIDCNEFREHLLSLRNISDTHLFTIDARVQVPEPIVESFGRTKPAGVAVEWQPIRMQMIASIQGNATVKRVGQPAPINVYRLQIDCIPPFQCIEIGFLTSTKIHDDRAISTSRGPELEEPTHLKNYIDGNFLFEYHGVMLKKRFFAPIAYNADARTFCVTEVREDFGEWQPVQLITFT